MDQFMVNCENEAIKIDDEVVLIGQHKDQSITVEEISALADTIPSETSTNMTEQPPRIYSNE